MVIIIIIIIMIIMIMIVIVIVTDCYLEDLDVALCVYYHHNTIADPGEHEEGRGQGLRRRMRTGRFYRH